MLLMIHDSQWRENLKPEEREMRQDFMSDVGVEGFWRPAVPEFPV
jgi:hypothetical protein